MRGPLPGIAHDLRLDDAGDAKPAWITLLTTEHYNLKMQRVATISESNGRASVFLGAVSAGLIALGFDSTRGASPIGHMIFQVLVLTPLVFLGLGAFVRCLEIAIDDWEFVTRITRLRRTYDQLVPELAPLMSQAVADEGVAAMLSPRWQPFQKMLSVAGSVAVITSVVLGGDAGVIVYGVSRLLYVAIAVGVAAGALALGWATWYQWRHWCQASPPSSREVTPCTARKLDLSVDLQVQEGIRAETECCVPVGSPSGADHPGARLARELHRDRPDTARSAMDQDGLACSEARVVEQALPCGQPGDRQGSGHGVVDIGRERSEVTGLHGGVLRQ